MTGVCTEAAEELARGGINAEVVDLLSVSPIDYDHVIESVRRTHRMVVVDEDTPICSLSGDICARVAEEAFDYLDAPPSRVTAPHTPVPYSRALEDSYVPNTARVIKTVQGLLSRV
jgi:pyruvate dehydrogenase E1 component beta subunit